MLDEGSSKKYKCLNTYNYKCKIIYVQKIKY